MEIEEKRTKAVKRKNPRSASEDPSDYLIKARRVKKTFLEYLTYQPSSHSTIFFSRPFNPDIEFEFAVQEPKTIGLEKCRRNIIQSAKRGLKEKCQQFIQSAHKIMGKEKETKMIQERELTLEEKQKVFLEAEFKAGVTDFNALSQQTKFSRQQIRNLYNKFNSGKSLLKDNRNQTKKKLNEEHCKFILEFFDKKTNYDKTIFKLYSELQTHFNFEEGYISYWTLYDYVHQLSLSYKNITYKIDRANIPSMKLKRAQIARTIISAHLASFDFVYIDEISFNLEMRPTKGWGKRGKQINAIKPPKSKNYSVIVAMDIYGYVGLKIIRGGVKGPEFISFMFELSSSESRKVSKKNTIFLMDNAKIHKSKDFMQKFAKYYNVLYNAPYTPQLNPIEFSFSKLKHLVKKTKPISEKDLVKKILQVANEISSKDCSEFIIHSLTFIERALEKEDFY